MKRVIKLILLFYVYQIIATLLCGGVFMLWNSTLQMPQPSSEGYVNFLMSVQVVFTSLVILHLIVDKDVNINTQTFAYYDSPKLLLSAIVFVVGLGLWNNYLSELVGLPNTMEAYMEDLMTHPLGIVSTVILAPIMEELLFRGAIQGYLLRVWKNPVWAILFSSLLFGLVHGNPVQIPFAFLIGLALGWVYYLTGSLLPSMLMHFVNNGSAVLLFWCVGRTEFSFIDSLGFPAATLLALVGIGITIGCIMYLRKLPVKPVMWSEKEENC